MITIVKPCTSPAFGGHCRVCTGASLDLTGLSFVESALSILHSTAALLPFAWRLYPSDNCPQK